MMAQIRPSPANPPGRISQMLPEVKCSNCSKSVPLADLGDHVCLTPPPVPSLPKPAVSPSQAMALLPQRLQNLVTTPTTPRSNLRDARSVSPQRNPDYPRQQERPRIVTANSYSTSAPSTSIPARPRDPYVPPNGSPLRTRSPPPVMRGRSGSVASNHSSPTPATARPPFAPQPPPLNIDTRAGGEGGMAGVGRRGFAAATRAAAYSPVPPRTNALDLNTASRCKHSTFFLTLPTHILL